jgi:hypothetical protein
MRVRVAYISSLGTTAILVAAALTLLTVVGAIVAFRGWPDGADGSGVQTVPLAPGVSPASAALVRRTAPAVRAGSVRKAPARRGSARASTAGLVKTAAGSPGTVPGLVMVPAHSTPPMVSHSTSPAQVTPVAQPGDQPEPRLPAEPAPNGPVPSTGGGLPLDLSSPPSPDPMTGMATGLLSGGGSPPPALSVGGIDLPLP